MGKENKQGVNNAKTKKRKMTRLNIKKKDIINLILIFIGVCVASILVGKEGFFAWIINNASGILGLVTAFLAYAAWAEANAIREERESLRNRQITSEETEQAALVLTTSEETLATVKEYFVKNNMNVFADKELSNSDKLESASTDIFKVKVEKSIVMVTIPKMPEGNDRLDDYFVQYALCINNTLRILKGSGISTLHLFEQIPVIMGTFTGTQFRNNFTIIGYHFNSNAVSNKDKYYRAYDRTFESYLSENEEVNI